MKDLMIPKPGKVFNISCGNSSVVKRELLTSKELSCGLATHRHCRGVDDRILGLIGKSCEGLWINQLNTALKRILVKPGLGLAVVSRSPVRANSYSMRVKCSIMVSLFARSHLLILLLTVSIMVV